MRPVLRLDNSAVLLLIVTLAVSFAEAAGQGRPPGRFDDYAHSREGGVIATAPRDVDWLDAADGLRLGWDEFRGRHGGGWSVYLDERSGMPTLVTGRGVEVLAADGSGGVTLDSLDDAVRAFLKKEASLLGDHGRWLVLDKTASAELRPGYWKLLFRQQVDGVRVENARLEFHLDRGRITMFGSSNWGVPGVSGVPTIDAVQARAILDAYLDGASATLEYDAEPELVLLALDAEPALDRPRRWTGPRGAGLAHALVWRVLLRDPDGPASWVGEIDAHHGRVLAFYDGAHYASVRGGVYPQQPGGDCAAGGCELDDFPMPYADWTESAQAEAIADPYGNFACNDPGSSFETHLIGQYVEVDDSCGAVSEIAGCSGSVRLGVKVGENCEGDPYASPGNTAAARSSYYHVNRVAEAARFYNPGNAWLHGRVTVNSNWPGSCNASYGGGGIFVYRSSSICANSGEIQGIAVHEWGHGYDQNDGGGWDNTSESYADMISLFASRESCFGPGLFIDGRTCSGYGDTCLTCTGFRDHDWAARQANTPATPQVFVQNNCDLGTGSGPCGGEEHCEVYPINESIFDLATRDLPAAGLDLPTAWQLVERLWYSSRVGSGGDIYTCALPASDSCAVGSWYQQLRAADDDDADLSNGTPHAAALHAAFARHNIACGSAGDPENQRSSSCPTMSTPQLTVTAPPAGTELSWTAVGGVSEYVVYRGDLGCNRQQIPVAVVPGSQTNWLDAVGDPDIIRDYRVEAVGANPVCRSAVSDCETTPNGPRLQKNAHRLVETGPNNNGNGRLEPGETVQLPVTLFNGGRADALNVAGRLRTVDPAQGRVVEPVAGWPDMNVGAEFESDLPHMQLTLFNAGVACGETVGLELEMTADAAATRTTAFEFTLGDKSREYPRVANEPLSRFITDPVLSTLDMPDDTVIGDLDVSVEISHTGPGDLIVELSSPQGTTVRLHDRTPGSGGIFTRYDMLTDPDGPGTMADFEGESTAGAWTLSVQNTVFGGGQGTFNDWTLHVTSSGAFDCDEFVCGEPNPSQSPDDFTVDKLVDGGDGSVDLVFAWNSVSGVAGYHVLQSPVAPFATAVDLAGRTDGATTLTLDDGVTSTPALTFFRVRSVNTCNQESP